MQQYPYSNVNYNHLGQQPYLGQYGNTNLARYTQNPNINFSQPSKNPVSIQKLVKKTQEKESSSEEEDDSKEDDEISISDEDDDEEKDKDEDEDDEKSKHSQSDSDSESRRSESESSNEEEEEEAKSFSRKKSSRSQSKNSNDSENEESDGDQKDKSVEDSGHLEIKIYPEIQERVKVFRNIVHELDDLERSFKKMFKYFSNENSEDAISDRFTRK